jgi:hypothetical protein
MADGKEEGEGEKEFHKCKVGEKIRRVIWQTFTLEDGSGEAGVDDVLTFPRRWEWG